MPRQRERAPAARRCVRAARLEHGLERAQRGRAVLALDAHVHERGVRVHVALHAARVHLVHQAQRALERALAVLAAALLDVLGFMI